jgi:rfaE bifunctional protein kinase chain/domain
MKHKEQKLRKLFEDFGDKKALIIGDVMVDAYIFGKVNRISPEAPVPIVDVFQRVSRLGGAANVALNIKSLGGTPVLCSVIGNDEGGFELSQLLFNEKMTTDGLMTGINRKTTKKFRVIGNSTQMLRIDEESSHPLTPEEEKLFLVRIQEILNDEDPHVIIFQDYDKGSITPAIIKYVTKWAQEHHIPVVVDPKKRNFLSYRNVTLFKPNLKEMTEGLGIKIDAGDISSIQKGIKKLHDTLHAQMTMVTLSEHGIAILDKEQFVHFPAHLRKIADVSGAGDTVISVAALCVACGINPDEIAKLSNLAGGLVCEHVGVSPIDKEQLLEEAMKVF